jgi:hypothetical protein
LETQIECDRDGFRVKIQFPGLRLNRYWLAGDIGSARHFFQKGSSEQGFAVRTLRVLVFGEGPPGSDTEASINYLRRTFQVAEAIVSDLVEWARINGQCWLGLHGQRPRRIEGHVLGDESDDIGDYCFTEDVLPKIEDEHAGEYEVEASIDASRVSLFTVLANNRTPLPIAETLLADALYFIQLNPADYQRAVLMAAIACEVKVKDTLREKVPPDRLPLVDLILENPRDWSLAAVALFDKATSAAFGRSLRADNREAYKDVGKLFELRNRIAHKGEKPEENEARRCVLSGRQVFRWLDELQVVKPKP